MLSDPNLSVAVGLDDNPGGPLLSEGRKTVLHFANGVKLNDSH